MSTPIRVVENKDGTKTTMYQRFNVHQRLQHVLIIVSFILLAISGIPIRWSNTEVGSFMVKLFGGHDNMLRFHLINGGIMLAASAYHIIYLFIYAVKHREFHLNAYLRPRTIKEGIQNVKYFLGLTQEKPRFDRYSWKEQFDYLAVFWGMFIIGGSGVFMWFPDWGTNLFPRWIIDMWRLGHSDEAILAVIVILVWHFYNVHFNPNLFPYNNAWWSGEMSEEMMLDEHPVELERIKAEQQAEEGYKPWLSKNLPSQKG